MIHKEHFIELFVNGEKVELESQNSLNMRFNNVLYNPEKISSTQAEYSFEFEIPSTPKNDRIFDYANNLSKLNKFHQRWNAEVYADGHIIFQGSLILNGYQEKHYQCNLVSVKLYSLEDIFGDAVLTDIPWEIPFEGAGQNDDNTIDYYNSLEEPDAVFPLVSYGAFQKSPKSQDSVGKEYSSKFDLDKYNRWYVESFYPSLNMLKTIKRAFNWKGYTVNGDVFQNIFLKDIFMSCNLADEQSPEYNLGNPKFGKVALTSSMSTATSGSSYQQELNFPYYRVDGTVEGGQYLEIDTKYNLSSINIYDILSNGQTTVAAPTYMYQPNEHIIVIPADGFYKIELSATTTLNTTGNITVMQNTYDGVNREFSETEVSLPVGLNENTPVEIALVRNYEDNYELIKGKHNKKYASGNPLDETYFDGQTYPNATEWLTCFPHEDPYNADLPTKQNNLALYNTQGVRRVDGTTNAGHVGVTRGRNGGTVGGRDFDIIGGGSSEGNNERRWSVVDLGYVYNDGDIMAYDKVVSPAFICGFSSFYGGTTSVMKNGYSWSKSVADRTDSFYINNGYQHLKRNESGGIDVSGTTYNANNYIESPTSSCQVNGATMNGSLYCLVYLKKNDVIQLFEIHRGYQRQIGTSVYYNTTTNVSLKIEAASPKSYIELKNKGFGYNSNTEFPYNLQLTNFLNKETKVSDWLQNIFNAFNFQVTQDNKTFFIDTKKKFIRDFPYAVDIDNRVNSNDAEASRIEYPKSMAVKYKIDTDEWGFEQSVTPKEKLNDPDWKDYGDSGFSEIMLSDDAFETSTSDTNIQFSYTWYDNFNWYPVNSSFEQEEGDPTTLTIPVISKFTYMIDGYDYDESMKHDGYGLTQRFWFRPKATTCYVYTRTYPVERVQIYEPKNLWTNYRDNNLNLSYKITEPSLLSEYFNITPYLSSNYVTVNVYLSPEEYKAIKNGCAIHFDSDIYYAVEINGFDASGNNPTELKMIKKI